MSGVPHHPSDLWPAPPELDPVLAAQWSRWAADTWQQMRDALSMALELRDSAKQIVEHSCRVAVLATAIADDVGVHPDERDALRHAAQLHEIGMIAVPADLLLRPGPLAPAELRRVRGQAAVGGEILRTTHRELTARLVSAQYTDYDRLVRGRSRGRSPREREILLAGILRVADVADAVSHPRPYQPPFDDAERAALIRAGAGTLFHPVAAHSLLRLLVPGAGPMGDIG